MNISPFISLKLIFHLGSFKGKLASGELRSTKDVAIALDELAQLAWSEVWDAYPVCHLPLDASHLRTHQ